MVGLILLPNVENHKFLMQKQSKNRNLPIVNLAEEI